ncbi:MAG: hypothetical protein ABW292_08470 [Vicinamibacterales bacterium]
MFCDRSLTRFLLAAVVLCCPATSLASQARPVEAVARQRPAVERPEAAQTPQTATPIVPEQDAKETRENLEEILKKLPPAVGRVLRTDPSLLANDSYLATYPALAAFLKQHPEVRMSPGFFFEQIGYIDFYQPESRDTPAVRIWRDLIQFVAVAGIFLTIASGLIWIIKTIVEYRRWNRVSKVHTEVHNKLLDRFTANEDLLAYMQTPAGKSFLESAPLSLDSPTRPMGAPLGRILWSVQAGVVLAAAGLGLLFVSGRVVDEVAQPLFAIGVLALAIGAGFVVSAAASFLLSRRLGLFEAQPAPPERVESSQ